MTQKKHRVMTNSWSHDEMWMDTKLEKLIWQATHLQLGQTRFQTTTYIVSTPIPPWMASQQENYGMVTTVTRVRFSKEIAEELIAEKGEFAYLYALEKLEGYESEHLRDLWKDVLIWLDELTGEKK